MARGGDFEQSDSRTRRPEIPAEPRLRRFPLLPPGAGQRVATGLGDFRLRLADAFEREMEAGRGFLWMPICFGIGILIYFALPGEPSAIAVSALALALAAAAWWSRRHVAAWRT